MKQVVTFLTNFQNQKCATHISLIDQLTSEHVLHIADTFDDTTLLQLLDKGRPGIILSDHYCYVDSQLDIEFCSLPLWIEREVRQWCIDDLESHVDTRYCFNFMVNKYKIHRNILIKLIESFGYQSFDYTYSGTKRSTNFGNVITDLAQHVDLLSPQQKSTFLSSIKLPTKFIDSRLGQTVFKTHQTESNRLWYPGNKISWDSGLNCIFSNSVVSLITETVEHEQHVIFTEKSIYAIMANTFPIWVGGYGLPNHFKRLGFDIFDDVIDHSYQYKQTLIERCVCALTHNQKILTDLDWAKSTRLDCAQRLNKNQQLLLVDNVLWKFIQTQINAMPSQLQSIVVPFVDFYRTQKSNMTLI